MAPEDTGSAPQAGGALSARGLISFYLKGKRFGGGGLTQVPGPAAYTVQTLA